jgi:hypothetical protein
MRDFLAEQLLAAVMGWKPADVAAERPLLQALADHKYDDYQQFAPGTRFLESLAYWLDQFKSTDEREIMYRFFRSRLIFCSLAEMKHLVSIAYPDHIRPILLARAGREAGLNPWHTGRIAATPQFRALQRQTLFLGLSDGAKTDAFRRANSDELTHEQVRQSHELAEQRVEKLLEKLAKGLTDILGEKKDEDSYRFRSIALLDDFSASGLSYIRHEGNAYDGKVGTFLSTLFEQGSPMAQLVDIKNLEVMVVLYMATQTAKNYLELHLQAICNPVGVASKVIVVHPLAEEVRIKQGDDPQLDAIIETYYDTDNETASTRIGGTDLKYGFAWCGLPLVLSHNTPNNSIGLLWAEGSAMRPLFPRITRHRDRV